MNRLLPVRLRPFFVSLIAAVPLALAIAALATWPMTKSAAQESSQQEQESPDEKDEAFHEKFWDYLNKAQYTEWDRFPADAEGFSEGKSPHGALLKTFANQVASDNPQELPVKSILVKHNYNEDEELIAITPMYRVGNDFDPDHNDWYWAKYKPDGTVFETDGMKLSGRLEGCIECHSSAGGEDYVFHNDE